MMYFMSYGRVYGCLFDGWGCECCVNLMDKVCCGPGYGFVGFPAQDLGGSSNLGCMSWSWGHMVV